MIESTMTKTHKPSHEHHRSQITNTLWKYRKNFYSPNQNAYTPKIKAQNNKMSIDITKKKLFPLKRREKILSIISNIGIEEDSKTHKRTKSNVSLQSKGKSKNPLQGKYRSTEQELQAKFRAKKSLERPIPQIITKATMNNLLIRDSRQIPDPIEYITISKYIRNVCEEYYQQKKKFLINRVKRNERRFNKLKKNITLSEFNVNDNEDKTSIEFRTLDEEYKSIKEIHKQNNIQRAKNQSRILAELILNMNKGEDAKEREKLKQLSTEPIIMKTNLLNSIYLKKIIKKKNLTLNEEINLDDPNLLRKELMDNQYMTSKVMKKYEKPRFIRETFKSETQIKFRGLKGKFFGVIC